MRDLGSPSHSLDFFRCLIETFPEAVTFHVVRNASVPVAASLTLTDQYCVRVPWAGADWRVRELNANMLLYWSMLEDACNCGAEYFDFGRSSRDSGTFRFKKQWGARVVPLMWQYVLAEGANVPELKFNSPKYRLMVACWKKLPLPLKRQWPEATQVRLLKAARRHLRSNSSRAVRRDAGGSNCSFSRCCF